MHDREAVVIDNSRIVSNYFLLKLRLEQPLDKPVAGQFVMLKVPRSDLFLRRPFSIYDYRGRTISIMYRAVGKGTEALSRVEKNERTFVLGPLGNGFTVKKSGIPVVITGGIGVAGVHLLVKRLGEKASIFYGCLNKEELIVIEDIMKFHPRVSTIDGSYGFKGNVVELFLSQMNSFEQNKVQVYTCGPEGMVKNIRQSLESSRTACQVLVEERMACGLGLCFGCVVKTTDEKEPYKRVCKEGPVFDLWQISL